MLTIRQNFYYSYISYSSSASNNIKKYDKFHTNQNSTDNADLLTCFNFADRQNAKLFIRNVRSILQFASL